MGYGAPAAVGAALANKKHGRFSVSIQTDGDLNYAPGVLWTAAHHQIPLLTIMHNNRGYHQEVMFIEQQASIRNRGADRAHIGTKLWDPEYRLRENGAGLWAVRGGADHRSERSGAGVPAGDCAGEEGRAGVDRCSDAAALGEKLMLNFLLLRFAAATVNAQTPRATPRMAKNCSSSIPVMRATGSPGRTGRGAAGADEDRPGRVHRLRAESATAESDAVVFGEGGAGCGYGGHLRVYQDAAGFGAVRPRAFRC